MKKIIVLGLLIVLSISSRAQFKNSNILQDYSVLVKELEPFNPTHNVGFYCSWMDTIISIHQELSEYLQISFPLDSSLLLKSNEIDISRESAELIRKIEFIYSLPSLKGISLAYKKKPKSKRISYEMQRLELIKGFFEQAKIDSNLVSMESTLKLLVYYYQNGALLSTPKALKEYKKQFLIMRVEYSNALLVCFKNNTCDKKRISSLFEIALNAWPDLNLAMNVLKGCYNQEWLYLFMGIDSGRLENVSFVTVTECYLSLLYLYNVAGNVENHSLINSYYRLVKLPFTRWEKENGNNNLRRYLNEKQKIFPEKVIL